MKTCYRCGTGVKAATVQKEGVLLECMRCPDCGEEYFTSSELLKFDIKKGNKKSIRKFGSLGDSTIMRFPPEILKQYKIMPGDYGLLEKRTDGILIRPIRAKEI